MAEDAFLNDDQLARHEALDTSASVSLLAPAGSGKTELLTQRILKLLVQVDRPEAILAITFTRKAASEMRARILNALLRAGSPADNLPPHELQTHALARAALAHSEEMNWQLLNNPGRLQILTIDGLCRQLADSLPLESGISLPPSISSDRERLYAEAGRRTFRYLDADHPIGDDLFLLLRHLGIGLDQLLPMLVDLLPNRDSWLPLTAGSSLSRAWLEDALERLIEEKLDDLLTELDDVLPQLGELTKHASDRCEVELETALEMLGHPHEGMRNQKGWRQLADYLLVKGKARARARVDKNMGFPPGDERKGDMEALLATIAGRPSLLDALHSLRCLPTPRVSEEEWRLIQSLTRVMTHACAELRLLQQESAQCDYTEVSLAAVQALGEPNRPTPLAERLDYRLEHILVDEFQDTSGTQVQLLDRLLAGWQPGDGRTLFIVGDAMQSIYEFRKANVALFHRICKEGIQDIRPNVLALRANFRSRPELVESVNEIFSTSLGAVQAAAQGFTPAQAARNSSAKSRIQYQGFLDEDAEGRAIAAHIASLLARGETDIAILVRNRGHLTQILPALRAEGIHWQAQDIDPLRGRMAVQDMDALTRALCCPGDRIAWLAVLRAPWAGLDQSDLLRIATLADEAGLSIGDATLNGKVSEQVSPAGQAILERIRRVFLWAFSLLGQVPLTWLVDRCWHYLDGPSTLLKSADAIHVRDYLELLEAQAPRGMIGDWESFDQALRGLYARAQPGANDSVQIMTIHKAKGLEFDHVILPALAKSGSAGGPSPLLVWSEREYRDGKLRFLLSPRARQARDNALYAYLLDEQQERRHEEQLRILYVAMTRARESLLMTSAFKEDRRGKLRDPARDTVLHGIWTSVAERFTANLATDRHPETGERRELNGIRRLPVDRPLPSPDSASLQTPEPGDNTFARRYLHRCLGDILHQDLSQLVGRHLDEDTVERLRSTWPIRLGALGMDEAHKEASVRQLTEIMGRLATSERLRWILTDHPGGGSEARMAILTAGAMLQHRIIDRTFIAQGVRWVIDYKTSAPGEHESMEEFLAVQRALHEPQLLRYAQLFKSEPVRTALYFPLVDHFEEIGGDR